MVDAELEDHMAAHALSSQVMDGTCEVGQSCELCGAVLNEAVLANHMAAHELNNQMMDGMDDSSVPLMQGDGPNCHSAPKVPLEGDATIDVI